MLLSSALRLLVQRLDEGDVHHLVLGAVQHQQRQSDPRRVGHRRVLRRQHLGRPARRRHVVDQAVGRVRVHHGLVVRELLGPHRVADVPVGPHLAQRLGGDRPGTAARPRPAAGTATRGSARARPAGAPRRGGRTRARPCCARAGRPACRAAPGGPRRGTPRCPPGTPRTSRPGRACRTSARGRAGRRRTGRSRARPCPRRARRSGRRGRRTRGPRRSRPSPPAAAPRGRGRRAATPAGAGASRRRR